MINSLFLLFSECYEKKINSKKTASGYETVLFKIVVY